MLPQAIEIDPSKNKLFVEIPASMDSPVDFMARLVQKGDRYGRDFCLVHDKDEPMIEFYDARYKKPGFTEYGQFITRYFVSTLESAIGGGLCLNGGVSAWNLSADQLLLAMEFAHKELGSTGFECNQVWS